MRTAPSGSWEQRGWPYKLVGADLDGSGRPTLDTQQRMVLNYKLISKGQDKRTVPYPFDGDLSGEEASDDLRSWE